MRKPLIAAMLFLAGAGVAGTAVAARDSDEAAYAKLLAGKVAGRPQACLDTDRPQAQLSAFGDKLIYKVSRSLVYVNQTTGGCENVSHGDALVTQRVLSRACRGDIARTVNLPAGGFQTGSCALGDFTPYRSQ